MQSCLRAGLPSGRDTLARSDTIEERLRGAFEVEHLDVRDESHQHNVPRGAESHFRVTLVSPSFEGQGLVQRHRAIYRLLADELAGPVHALALHTYTPSEWLERDGTPASPPCLGGGQ